MEKDEAVEKRRAILAGLMRGRALCQISRSYALFVPTLWLRLYGWEVDGKYWIKVEQDGDKITISPIDRVEAEKMMEVNDASIRPE